MRHYYLGAAETLPHYPCVDGVRAEVLTYDHNHAGVLLYVADRHVTPRSEVIVFTVAERSVPSSEIYSSCPSKTTIETSASVPTGRLRRHTSSRSGEWGQDTSVYGYGETDCVGYRSCDWGESSRSTIQTLVPLPSSFSLLPYFSKIHFHP